MNKCAIRLRELRIGNKLTINALSKLLNISAATLSKYEKTGSKIRLTTLFKLCTIFNVRLDYLLGLSDIKTPISTYKNKA